jgi:hypothetical protein
MAIVNCNFTCVGWWKTAGIRTEIVSSENETFYNYSWKYIFEKLLNI